VFLRFSGFTVVPQGYGVVQVEQMIPDPKQPSHTNACIQNHPTSHSRFHLDCFLVRSARILKVVETTARKSRSDDQQRKHTISACGSPQRDAKVHVGRRKVGLQVDGRGQIMERGCVSARANSNHDSNSARIRVRQRCVDVLSSVQVNKPQVVGNDPLERIKVQSTLQTRNRLRESSR
jgi:hypothetical protein